MINKIDKPLERLITNGRKKNIEITNNKKNVIIQMPCGDKAMNKQN